MMVVVLLSLLISTGITTLAYCLYRQQSKASEVTRVRQRLGVQTEAERLSQSEAPALIRSNRRSELPWLRRFRLQRRIGDKLQLLIESAGLESTPERVYKQSAAGTIVAAAAALFATSRWLDPMSPWLNLLAIPAAVTGGWLPVLKLRRAARKRLERFEAQFPGALEFIARSMRAGHAFSISLEMLYRECEQPIAGEFRRVFEEQNLGMPLDAALGRLAARIRLIDVQFFVSAVILQRKTGGNLTEILDTLAEVIRERYKLKGKVRAISAHGRMTSKALSAIPIVVGAMMFFVNHEYVSFFLYTLTGLEMLAASLVLQVIAYVVINKIVTIEV